MQIFTLSLSMAEWVVVANFDTIYDASGAQAVLEAADIWCDLKDVNSHGFMKPYDLVGSAIKLIVRDLDSAKAVTILLEAGIIKKSDLGPDKKRDKLNKILKVMGADLRFEGGKSGMIYIFLGLVFLFLLIVIIGYGGGKY